MLQIFSLIRKQQINILLFLICLLAVVLRFWHLGTLPFGFHNDEVMNGYVGRFILQNSVDLYGHRWPILYFDNFGDYPNVIPMYISGAFTFIFGVNEFAVRFPIALAGVLTVFVVYVLARWLWKPAWVALVAAGILAVMPWHIVLSRATAEGVTAALIFLLSILVVFHGLANKRWWLVLTGWLGLFSTYLLYPGYRVFVPLAFLPAVLLVPKRSWKIFLGCLTVILFLGTLMISQTVWGKGRFDQTSIFLHNNVIGGRAINYSIGLGEGHILEARIFSNKYVLVGREFIRQYVSYFSPDFLAGEGGKPLRYLVPEHGVFYWTFFVVLAVVIGKHFLLPWKKEEISQLFHSQRAKYSLWLFWILVVAPIPAALTLDDVPNVHRTLIMAPLLALLLSGGWYFLAQIKLKKISFLAITVGLFLCGETIFFWHYYTGLHSVATTPYRHDEQRSLSEWLLTHRQAYRVVYAPTGEGLQIHYLFQEQNFSPNLAGHFSTGLRIDRVDNIMFVDTNCPSLLPGMASSSGTVFVDRSECGPTSGFVDIAHIKRLDITDAYDIRVSTMLK